MNLIYTLGMAIYAIATYVCSFWNEKARARVHGLKGSLKRLREARSAWKEAPVAWFHCASLGEFEQGRPLLEAFKSQHPDHKIVLTFFSASGYEIRKNYASADLILYLPYDLPWQVNPWIRTLSPEYVFFIKYEYWANILKATQKCGARIFMVSAIFKPEQVFFKFYGAFFRKVLTCFEHFFVQNEDSKILLERIGITKVSVTGDTRFDRVISIAKQAKKLDFMQTFAGDRDVFVAGSTWPKDEALLAEALDQRSELKLVMVPHEISEDGIRRLMNLFPSRKAVRYTQMQNLNLAEYDLLIIDTIGLLSSVYRYGKYAYIGGGFGVGIHNTLEAAVYGIPVFFGTNYRKFQEACNLIADGGAFSCANAQSLTEVLGLLQTDPQAYAKAAGAAGDLVAVHAGATEKVLLQVFGQ